MEETIKAEFHIEVSATDATDEELDRMTRQLLSELRELNIESAKLTKGRPAPAGSKGAPIAIELMPAVLPSTIGLVKQAWMTRRQGRTVKFKGKGIEFEGSTEELQKLFATLDKGKKKK